MFKANVGERNMKKPEMIHQIRQAAKFFLLAIPGMALFLFSSLMIFSSHYDPHPNDLSPLFSVPLAIVGLLVALVGTGNWNRWRFLFVLASVPASLFAFILLDVRSGKLAPFIVIAIVAFIANHFVKRSYGNQKIENRQHQNGH